MCGTQGLVAKAQEESNFNIYVTSGVKMRLENGTIFEIGATAQEMLEKLQRAMGQQAPRAMAQPEVKETPEDSQPANEQPVPVALTQNPETQENLQRAMEQQAQRNYLLEQIQMRDRARWAIINALSDRSGKSYAYIDNLPDEEILQLYLEHLANGTLPELGFLMQEAT